MLIPQEDSTRVIAGELVCIDLGLWQADDSLAA